LTAQHVSSDIIAHHHELNCNNSFWFYSLEAPDDERYYRSSSGVWVYSLEAPDDERYYRSSSGASKL